MFENGTFSDGLAPYNESWLWDNNHFKIQRIRREEQPSGCDVSRYNTNLVWISGSSGMQFSVNDEVVGTYQAADDAHGYIFEYPIKMGDKLCAVDYKPVGFSTVLGTDIYYHYDSYCYRGFCRVFKHFSGFGFFLLPSRIHARPHAGNANRSAVALTEGE